MQDTTRTSGGLSNIKPNSESCLARQADERIKAKLRDPTSKQIIELGLCDPEPARSLCLGCTKAPLHSMHEQGRQCDPDWEGQAIASELTPRSTTIGFHGR